MVYVQPRHHKLLFKLEEKEVCFKNAIYPVSVLIYIRKAKSSPSIFNQPLQQSCCHTLFISHPNCVHTNKYNSLHMEGLPPQISIILEIYFQIFAIEVCLLLNTSINSYSQSLLHRILSQGMHFLYLHHICHLQLHQS